MSSKDLTLWCALSQPYICQLSSKNKTAGSSRDLGCPSRIHLKLRNMPRRPLHKDTKDGFLCEVHLQWCHNHAVHNMQALQHLRMSESIKSTALRLFAAGVGVAGVKRILEDSMDNLSCLEEFYCRQSNPSDNQLEWLLRKWRKGHWGTNEQEMLSALEKRKEELMADGFDIISDDSQPTVCCIVSPIMKRCRQLPSCDDVLFCDTTSSVDRQGMSVTFIMTATKAGAVPVCVLLHNGQSEEVYTACFSLARRVTDINPRLFMTDDSMAERNALRSVFPAARLLLCLFHRSQATWRWLREDNHRVPKEARKTCMAAYMKVLWSLTPEKAVEQYDKLIEEAEDYPTFTEYMARQWEDRDSWVLGYRYSEPLAGSNTNNYSEATVRIVKDIVLCRLRSFNMVAFIEFFCLPFERYLRTRILNAASASGMSAKRLDFRKKVNLSSTLTATAVHASLGLFQVNSSKDSSVVYEVDIQRGYCTCYSGLTGGCCKHQLAAADAAGVRLPNIPVVVSRDDKHQLALLALGDSAPPPGFFDTLTLRDDSSVSVPTTTVNAVAANSTVTSSESMETDIGQHSSSTPLSAHSESVKSEVVDYFQSLLSACQSVDSEDHRLFAAMKRFHRSQTLNKRTADDFASSMHIWCQRVGSAGRLRVIRTQSTAAARRKTAYKGGRSLTVSQLRGHKLATSVRHGVAAAKKH